MPRWTQTFDERFWSKVDRRGDDECWPWIAYVSPDRYGRFYINGGSMQPSHRVAYELHHGEPIPAGMEIDHLCFNRTCANPAHLRLLSTIENRQRTRPALATHCPRGHEYDGSRNKATGRRYCRECARAREVRRTARRLIARQAARKAAA